MKFPLLAGLALATLAACDMERPDVETIPEVMQGRWGLVAADCDPARDDAKGLMEVAATSLRFYETRATLAGVQMRDATRITADFAFTGEGQSWTRRISLAAVEGGLALRRDDAGNGPEALHVTYRRCP
ncbi:hypothetical protein [Seohaeicola zhoushanensis]|uniref:Lipoprotein n=1 Tax=Seohaeicola zhoushanensis TaxID=1569283 RepID=A0A8J3M4L9_9RHOB|nr:hypothetical protein [Seohaeicola zhoushanensis]GHF39824.1 hypothetical protein GCM10017056_09200 [Seohaeicola zhoushanensis]